MEERNANVIFGKAGGNASKNSYTCKLSIPKTWVDRMGVRLDSREVKICFDGDILVVWGIALPVLLYSNTLKFIISNIGNGECVGTVTALFDYGLWAVTIRNIDFFH